MNTDWDKYHQFFKNLDRSFFLPKEYKKYSASDRPIPIGHNQTASQPSLVLKMTATLGVEKGDKILEIGTGCGYQTAFLAEFAKKVYSVELIEELSKKAQLNLHSLGYNNIEFKIGDGSGGWQEKAPFDKIMVTAAVSKIPKELVIQLKKNGRMIIPIGSKHNQKLVLVTKDKNGNINKEKLESVVFVEFKGKYGF